MTKITVDADYYEAVQAGNAILLRCRICRSIVWPEDAVEHTDFDLARGGMKPLSHVIAPAPGIGARWKK